MWICVYTSACMCICMCMLCVCIYMCKCVLCVNVHVLYADVWHVYVHVCMSAYCAYRHMHVFMCMHVCVCVFIWTCMHACACYVCTQVCIHAYVVCSECMHVYVCVFWNILHHQYTVDFIILKKTHPLWLQPSHIIHHYVRGVPRTVPGIMNNPFNISGIWSSKRKWYNPRRNWTSRACMGPKWLPLCFLSIYPPFILKHFAKDLSNLFGM